MGAILGAAIIGGAIGLGQTIFGGLRMNKGRKEYESLLNNLPKYEIPGEYKANQTLAKGAMQNGMPGSDIAKNQIYSSTEAGLNRAEQASASSSDLLGATVDMYAKELENLNNLAFQNASYKAKGLETLMGANQAMAGQKEKQWETNTWTPAQMRLNIAQSKMSSGQAMFGSGIGGLAGTITGTMTQIGNMRELDKIFSGASKPWYKY